MTPSNIVLNHSPTALFTSGSYPKAQRVVLFLIGFKGKPKYRIEQFKVGHSSHIGHWSVEYSKDSFSKPHNKVY